MMDAAAPRLSWAGRRKAAWEVFRDNITRDLTLREEDSMRRAFHAGWLARDREVQSQPEGKDL